MNKLVDFVKPTTQDQLSVPKVSDVDQTMDDNGQLKLINSNKIGEDEVNLTTKNILYGSRSSNRVVVEMLKASQSPIGSNISGGKPHSN